MHKHKIEPEIPSKKDILMAEQSSRVMESLLSHKDKSFELQIKDTKSQVSVNIPASALKMLFSALYEMSLGNAVTMIPVHAELTTKEAAKILNVSRPFLIGLLDKNEIPYRKVGTRRKILFKDIIKYKNDSYKSRLKALGDLAKDGQDLDMGY